MHMLFCHSVIQTIKFNIFCNLRLLKMSRTVHVLTSVACVTTVSHCTKNITSRTQGPAVLDIQGRNQRFCWEGAHQMEMVLCLCLLYLNALTFCCSGRGGVERGRRCTCYWVKLDWIIIDKRTFGFGWGGARAPCTPPWLRLWHKPFFPSVLLFSLLPSFPWSPWIPQRYEERELWFTFSMSVLECNRIINGEFQKMKSFFIT